MYEIKYRQLKQKLSNVKFVSSYQLYPSTADQQLFFKFGQICGMHELPSKVWWRPARTGPTVGGF